jgi:hypothetical protein
MCGRQQCGAPPYEIRFKVSVSAYSLEYAALKDMPITSCTGAYDSKSDGTTNLLILNGMMYFGNHMTTTLINVSQMRAFGHAVEDCPQQFNQDSSHSIKTKCGMDIPLKMKGAISYVPMCKPTNYEVAHSPWIEMALDMPWDPHSQDFANAEQRAERQTAAVENAQQPLGDVMKDNHDLERARYFCERPIIAACIIADDNLLVCTRLSEANHLTDLAIRDNTQGSVQIFSKTGKRTVFCCKQASSCVIGTSCENCFDPNVKVTAINTTQSNKNPISAEKVAKR